MKSKYLLCILMAITGCNNSSTIPQTTMSSNDSIQTTMPDDTGKHEAAQTTVSTSALDSLDQANAAMVATDDESIQKAWLSKADSSIQLTANMRLDHRIFGYAQPDIHSKRMLLISIFTNDVKDNPFQLPYGAYYETNETNGIRLKYTGEEGSFIKANASVEGILKGPVYIEKRWIRFED